MKIMINKLKINKILKFKKKIPLQKKNLLIGCIWFFWYLSLDLYYTYIAFIPKNSSNYYNFQNLMMIMRNFNRFQILQKKKDKENKYLMKKKELINLSNFEKIKNFKKQ